MFQKRIFGCGSPKALIGWVLQTLSRVAIFNPSVYEMCPTFSPDTFCGYELEADQIGLTYMARAGYDPRESVAFWKRMMAASQGAKPPELMSTHPADQTRINQLEQLMPAALEIYQKAVQQ